MPTTPHDGLSSRTNLANMRLHAHREEEGDKALRMVSSPGEGSRRTDGCSSPCSRVSTVLPQDALLGVLGFQAEGSRGTEDCSSPLWLGELVGIGRWTAFWELGSLWLFEAETIMSLEIAALHPRFTMASTTPWAFTVAWPLSARAGLRADGEGAGRDGCGGRRGRGEQGTPWP